MKIAQSLKLCLGTVTMLGLLATGQQAQAGVFHNGWTYSIDSFRDGTEGNIIGENSDFEFYGMAYRETRNKVYFAFNSNLSLDGYDASSALNKKISYGDLFLNFANPASFNQANGNLYGIRFDGTNDSRFVTGSGKQRKEIAPTLGLYNQVSTTSVTSRNQGYGSLQSHTNTVKNLKGSASYGDLAANTTYFDNSKAALTSMSAGNFLGAISTITNFNKLNLDFDHFKTKGNYTFGFSVDRKLLPNGNFIANLFAECGNDGIALSGSLKDVPEPSVLAGLATVGLLAAARYRRRHAVA